MKVALEEVERDRDAYKYKLSEKNRELDRLSEQVHTDNLCTTEKLLPDLHLFVDRIHCAISANVDPVSFYCKAISI